MREAEGLWSRVGADARRGAGSGAVASAMLTMYALVREHDLSAIKLQELVPHKVLHSHQI